MQKPIQSKGQGYVKYERDFDKLLISARVPSKIKGIKFLMVHKNHFLQEVGGALNKPLVIKIDGLDDSRIRKALEDNLEWIMKTAEYKMASVGKELLYKVIYGQVIKSFYTAYQERKKDLGDKLTEREITYLVGMKWAEGLKDDEKKMKEMATLAVSGAQFLLPAIIGGVCKTMIETYQKQISAVGSDFNECIEIWDECEIIEPIFAISVCPNASCKHYEFLISSNPQRAINCPTCGSKWVRAILYTLKEPFSSLKLEAKDLSIFLSAHIKASLSLPDEVVPECILSDGKNESQADIWLKNLRVVFECKIHDDKEVTTQEKLVNIYREDAKRLIKNLERVSLRDGYLVINIDVNDKQLSKLEEETRKLLRGKKLHIEIIAADSPEKFLGRLNSKLRQLDEKLKGLPEFSPPALEDKSMADQQTRLKGT